MKRLPGDMVVYDPADGKILTWTGSIDHGDRVFETPNMVTVVGEHEGGYGDALLLVLVTGENGTVRLAKTRHEFCPCRSIPPRKARDT